jgi:hypothetical protein
LHSFQMHLQFRRDLGRD